MTVICCCWM